MTSITQLTYVISQALDIPEATVGLHARIVREAGLLTQGGRGRSSARMTPTDAAVLLMAVASARTVKDTLDVTRGYLGLEGQRRGWFDLQPDVRQPPVQFVDALAWFIEAAGQAPRHSSPPDMTVRLHGPRPAADIEFKTSDGVTLIDRYEPFLNRPSRSLSDFQFSALFSEVTVFEVGAVIAGTHPTIVTTAYRADGPPMPNPLRLKSRPPRRGA